MQTSANYTLKLMEGTDNVKRQDFVDNFTTIDTQMKIINDNSYPGVTATGTNSYVGTTDRIKTLGKGTKLTLFVTVDATGSCTLNLNSYGAKNIKDSFGNIVTNLKKDIPYNLCYNGMDFILQGKGGGGTATANTILSGYTASTDTGLVTGTIPTMGSEEYAGWRRATVSTASIDGRVHLCIPDGYYNGQGNGGMQGVFSDDANFVAANLLGGKSYFGLNGGIANNYGIWKYSGTPMPANGRLHMYPPKGYYDPAGGTGVYYDSPDFVAANILDGKNIFGMVGNLTTQSLIGAQYMSGTAIVNSNATYYGTISIYTPFAPNIIVVQGKCKLGTRTSPFDANIAAVYYRSYDTIYATSFRYGMLNSENHDPIIAGTNTFTVVDAMSSSYTIIGGNTVSWWAIG